MFNNIVLDVAIGLTFIYLLYSLLATTIKEFIATLFSYRARMLEKGIEQMLDGKNFSYYWWDRLWNFINKKNKEKPGSKFQAKKNLFTNSISCHPLYVRSGENSTVLKNNKPAYLSADVFSDILIDVLKPNKDQPAILADIAAAVKNRAANDNDPLNKDLGKILTLYIDQAEGNIQRFKLLIENWYNDTMARVGGWYKRQANRILIGIGLVLAIAFNVSTIDIVKKLSEDKDVRNALVSNATDYVKSHLDDVKNNQPITKSKKDSLQNTVATDSTQATSTSDSTKAAQGTAGADSSTNAIRQKIATMKSLYNDNIAEANTTMGLGWDTYGVTKRETDSLKNQYDSLYRQYRKDSLQYETCVQQKKSACIKPGKPEKKWIVHWYEKLWYIFWQTLTTPHYWIGFLVTAFAISLGAPFWFDLLNRFVNLRVSGAKPDAGSATPAKKS